jgi:hypothetical protein
VFGWLLLIVALFMGGQAFGGRSLPEYDWSRPGMPTAR